MPTVPSPRAPFVCAGGLQVDPDRPWRWRQRDVPSGSDSEARKETGSAPDALPAVNEARGSAIPGRQLGRDMTKR